MSTLQFWNDSMLLYVRYALCFYKYRIAVGAHSSADCLQARSLHLLEAVALLTS
jgi:hypothetical protein